MATLSDYDVSVVGSIVAKVPVCGVMLIIWRLCRIKDRRYVGSLCTLLLILLWTSNCSNIFFFGWKGYSLPRVEVGKGIHCKWAQKCFKGDGNVLKLDCDYLHNCKLTKNHWIIAIEWVNLLCRNYISIKLVLKKGKKSEKKKGVKIMWVFLLLRGLLIFCWMLQSILKFKKCHARFLSKKYKQFKFVGQYFVVD